MNLRSANRLWMAWSLVLLLAIAGTLWVAAKVKSTAVGQEILAPVRAGAADLGTTAAGIEPVATQLEASADEIAAIARRQLPRPPFGLAEPPFVQEMRQREEELLATLSAIADRLQESNRRIVDLQQEMNGIQVSMGADLDEAEHRIGLVIEVSETPRVLSGYALALLGAAAALSTFVLAWRRADRKEREERVEDDAPEGNTLSDPVAKPR